MSKKRLDRLLSHAVEVANRLGEGDGSLDSRELDQCLSEAGYDPEDLRVRLHTELKALAMRVRGAGQIVPSYLRHAIETTAALETLAVRQPKTAQARVRQSLRDLADVAARAVPLPKGPLSVSHAYRKTDELTPSDRKLLDDIENELKSRMASTAKDREDDSRKQ